MAYETILTNVGLQKIASATPEHQLKINRIAVGDGNGGYSPLDPDMTELVNEVWRGPASAPIRDRNDATVIIFEGQIPANVGGFFIREVGIFDDAGDLIAIGHTAATEKPQDTSGTALTLTVRFRVKLSNASETELIYNDEAPIDHQGTTNRDAPDAHPISSITGLDNALNGKADKSTFVFAGTGLTGGGALSSNVTLSVDFGTGAGKVTEGNDERLSNAREWTAETVSQAEAEAGTSTTRRAWTAQRVRQAIVAGYNALTSAFGRTLANASNAATARNTLGLGTAATHDVTTSPTDTTVGRVLKVGDFGIGSSEELACWRDQAALLDPAAYRFYNGVDDGASWSFTVPAGETWYALALWRGVTPSDNTHLFLRVSDVFRPLPLPAGTTIQAAAADSYAYICRPALVVDSDSRYNDPRGLYFDRLARLRTLTLHQQTVQVPSGSSAGSTFITDFPADFANGFIVGVSAHDVSWVGLNKEGAGTISAQNHVSDEHQIRFAEAVKFPFRRAIFPQLRARAANIFGDLSGSSLQGYGAVFYYKLPADW